MRYAYILADQCLENRYVLFLQRQLQHRLVEVEKSDNFSGEGCYSFDKVVFLLVTEDTLLNLHEILP